MEQLLVLQSFMIPFLVIVIIAKTPRQTPIVCLTIKYVHVIVDKNILICYMLYGFYGDTSLNFADTTPQHIGGCHSAVKV